MKAVAAAIAAMKGFSGAAVVEGVELSSEDVLVTRRPKDGLVVASEGAVVVGLETALTPELVAEGDARELVSRVQAMRKAADFEVTQRIVLSVATDDVLRAALESHLDYIKGETLAVEVELSAGTGDTDVNGHGAALSLKAVQTS